MAKGKIQVGGLSIKDIMNIPMGELSTYSLTDIKNLTSRLVSAGNKRARRFIAKYGANSIKLKSYTSKGKFSVKGIKTTKEALSEFERVSEFLSRKTSSIKGLKAYKKRFEAVAQDYGVESEIVEYLQPKDEEYDIDKETIEYEDYELQEGEVWQTLDDLIEENKSLLEDNIRYNAHDIVKDYMSNKRKSKTKDFNEEQKQELRDILDKYIQDTR